MASMFILFGGMGLAVSLAGFGIKSLLELDEVATQTEK
jgi:hypothetical protein